MKELLIHDLRHTFATLSLENGIDLKTLQDILGHESISFTGDTYSHVTDKMKSKAADIMDGILNEVKK